MTATEDRDLRRGLHSTLQSVQPSPAPLETIVRRGKGIRLRRAGAAAGCVTLAGIVAAVAVALHGGAGTAGQTPVPLAPVVPGGVIAHGTAAGHPWRLAVQNIADPGNVCLPAITLNGTDADPVYPHADTGAVVALGPSLPGVGFGFVQLPSDTSSIFVNGVDVPAVTVAACGLRYHVAGFAYSLAEPLRMTSLSITTMPVVSIQPPSGHTTPESPGLWINTSSAVGETDSGTLAWGTLANGPQWYIALRFGPGGDCYEFHASDSQMGYCGPVSTPAGPETIMALPLGFSGTGATGYALQVSPGTGQLIATLSDGSTVSADFSVVAERKYAAFIVTDPLRLVKLTWYDAGGRPFASTTALPQYGYTQYQP